MVIGSGCDGCAVVHLVCGLGAPPDISRVTGAIVILKTVRVGGTNAVFCLIFGELEGKDAAQRLCAHLADALPADDKHDQN
jgi:MinD superfamily P-loop ATPase